MYQDTNMNRTFSISRGGWLVVIMLLGLAAGLVSAAESNAPVPDPAAAPNGVTIDPNQATLDPASGLIKFIAFQKDSNIRDGLRLLAALCRKNIVPSSQADGPLTVSRLYNVTFEEALNAILGHGFKFKQDGDFVRVYTAEEYKAIREDPERMIHKVITLYYITAEEAGKLVQPVLSASAKVQMSTPAQKSISGSTGGSAGGSGGLTSSNGGDDLALNDMIVIFDYPENIEKAESVIRQLDVRPIQILVEATILSARLTEETEFGIDWNLLNGTPITGFPATIINGQGAYADTTGFAKATGGLRVGFSADNVQAIIRALETVTDTTLLANPKILAVNKQQGSVLIGKKLGYLDTTTQTQTSTTQSVKFLNTGTELVFRPYVADDGYIRMDIHPKDSDGIVKDNGIPDETTTELTTNVIVKDGETVVIGGLFRDSVTTSRSQVPLLGSVPIMGVLFRGTKDTVVREEVIVMLTPHIIREPAETRPEDRADDVRMKREAVKDSLQIVDRARIAEETYAKAAKSYLEGDLEAAMSNLKLSLQMRPTYLEALRLRERIIAETDPEQFKRLDSIAVEKVDEQEAENWLRR